MAKKNLSFSICLPVYKGSYLLKDCLTSIAKQGFKNYEIIIGEDTPPECKDEIRKTLNVINRFPGNKIRYFKNKQNLGYPRNLQKIVAHAKNDVLFLMGQDDILARNALQKTHDAFFLSLDIGAVTRPYFWYDDDISKPVRAIFPPHLNKNSVLSVSDGEDTVRYIFNSLGQLSGLALRREIIDTPFHDDVFPAHIYPFAGILKKYRCVYLKDYTVAVRIKSSQARHISSIYNVSPLESWVTMFNSVYNDGKFKNVRSMGIKNIATQYVGFIQIKNFGPKGAVGREVLKTLEYYPRSILSPQFWLYSLMALLIPKSVLGALTDNYKKYILSRSVANITFEAV